MDMLADILTDFHWLRPLWLLALLPLAGLLWLGRGAHTAAAWRRVVDPELLAAMAEHTSGRHGGQRWLAGLIGIVTIVALAGPTWQRAPQPVYTSQAARVIVLDLSRSMDAKDVSPSRVVRARFAALDLLDAWDDGRVGVVAFAGDAHAVVPLTEDHDTARHLLASLGTDLMPVQGSNIAAGLEHALTLLQQGGAPRGEIVLLTDSPADARAIKVAERLRDQDHRLAVVGFGSVDGAPVPAPSGGWLRRRDDSIVIAKLQPDSLQRLARAGGGVYQPMPATTLDADTITPSTLRAERGGRVADDQQSDQWQDAGVWLTLALLPLALLAFRRNGLAGVVLIGLGLHATPGHAASLDDLWRNADQRGHARLEAGDADAAARTFRDPHWRGIAAYQAGDFATAVDALEPPTSARQAYNLGNARARAGDLDGALDAYDQALSMAAPTDEDLRDDTHHNRALVEALRQQQQAQQQDQGQGEPQSGDDGDPSSDNRGQPSDSDGGTQSADSGADAGSEPPSGDNSADQSGQPDPSDPSDPSDKADGSDQSDSAPNPDDDAAATDPTEAEAAAALSEAERADAEQEQALSQWLRRVPDDPGGLLRRKFQREQQRRTQEGSATRPEDENAW